MSHGVIEREVLSLRRWTEDSMPRAIEVARKAHESMFRDDGSRYLDHPLRAAVVLAKELGVLDEASLLLAVLHDVAESPDSPVPPVLNGWSSLDADIWLLGTKTGATRAERNESYAREMSSAELRVRLVKLADRIDNVRSLQTNPSQAKISRYVDETIRFYVPLAESTSSPATALLKEALDRLPGDAPYEPC